MLSDRYDALLSLTPAPFTKNFSKRGGVSLYEDADTYRARVFELIALLFAMLGGGLVAGVGIASMSMRATVSMGDLWLAGAIGLASLAVSGWVWHIASRCRHRSICLAVRESDCQWTVTRRRRVVRSSVTPLDRVSCSCLRVRLIVAPRAGLFWEGWAIVVAGSDWRFCVAMSKSREEIARGADQLPPTLMERAKWSDEVVTAPGLA